MEMEQSRVYSKAVLAMIFRVYDGPEGSGLITFETLRQLTADDIKALQTALGDTNKAVAALGVPVARIAALEARAAMLFTGKATLGTLAIGGKIMTMAVPGILAGDIVHVSPQVDLPAGISVAWARASAKDTVKFAVTVPILLSLATETTFDIVAWRR